MTVIDDNRCQAQGSATILNESFDTRTTIIQQPACDSIVDGIIQLDIREGFADSLLVALNGPTTIQQFADNSIIQFDSLPSGKYTINLTNEEGCQRVIERELQPFSLDVRLLDWTSCGERLGAVNLILDNAVDETSTYTVKWPGPTEGELPPSQYQALIIDSLAFREYTFQVINNRGCIAERTFDFAVWENCSNCPGFSVHAYSSSLTTHFSISDGTPPYQVNYSTPDGEIVSNEVQSCEFGLTFSESGTYSVSIIDSNGCEWMSQIAAAGTEFKGCLDIQLAIDIDSIDCTTGAFDLPILISGGSG
ncbi:MAG: hypothetical protein AAGI23_03055 [Bacteroidota bacterium]